MPRDEAGKPPRFKLTPLDQVRMSTTALYLVKGLIPREGLVVIWGPPKCGKTFKALDIAMHIALGWPYRGRRVSQGAVVYVALEGELGIATRIEAFRRERLADQTGPVPFYLLVTRLDLAADRTSLVADIRAQLGEPGCAAIVIDTLNRSLAGSESSDQDMSAYIKGADAVREAFGCAVIIIHHCGHDATRARGHTSLLGAADAQIAVRREADGRVVALLEYMKDGPAGATIASTLKVVELDQDEDGDPITSCVVEPSGDDTIPVARQRLSARNREALEKLDDLLARSGRPAPVDSHYPARAMVVGIEEWRQHLKDAGVLTGEPTAMRQAWKRCQDALRATGEIGIWKDLVWSVAAVRTVTESVTA